MTLLPLLSAAIATTAAGPPTHLDPLKLFLDADIVVKVVMAGLLLASLWVWAIIFSFALRMGNVRRGSAAYEEDFWDTADFEALQKKYAKKDVPFARVAAAGFGEWKQSAGAKTVDREGLRQRMALTLDSEVAQEADRLADRLNFLATVGSVGPFVGLFGTVWGIMNSFFQIGQEQNSSLAVVAPARSRS
jgi:biopolymer transport protein TolQ